MERSNFTRALSEGTWVHVMGDITYERSVPIRGQSEVESGRGAVYVVSGGAGAVLYPNADDEWFNAVANAVEHFVIAEFAGDEVTLTARDPDLNVIDSFTKASNAP